MAPPKPSTMIEIDLCSNEKTKNAIIVPAIAGKRDSSPIRGLGKANMSKMAMPMVASRIAVLTSRLMISSLSRAARYAPVGVRVMPYPALEYFRLSSSARLSISSAALRAKVVSVLDAMGLAITSRCRPSADMSCPLYMRAF